MINPSTTKNSQRTVRPPIVVVMGHIDHGKTKILDWYRKTKLVEQESGGITQHIGAYEVEHEGRKITFIDTPGHEAFSKIRSRGAKAADMAILVVAADESVKPQTKEAVEIIKQNNLPFTVAINKIDKPEANIERVKQDLAKEDVLVESYGGKVPAVEISAKMGKNMNELLEVLLLLAELEDLKSDPEQKAEGVAIESHLDPRRGATSTLLILNGTLKKTDILVIGRKTETIKIFENFKGNSIEEGFPSSPVVIAGLGAVPMVGEEFRGFTDKTEAEEFVKNLPPEKMEVAPSFQTPAEKPIFNLIIKTDVVGSREAIEESIKKIESEKIGINIIKSEVGDINESDIKTALSTKLITVLGFKVKMDPLVRELAGKSNIHIVTGEVIYELLDGIKKKMEDILPKEIKRIDLGKVKILKIFKKEGSKQIVGGRVEEGVIKNGAKVEIKRMNDAKGNGSILELQRNKIKTEEVSKGSEFGAMIGPKTEIKEGDILEIYEEELMKKTL